jgi:hypothetical protein
MKRKHPLPIVTIAVVLGGTGASCGAACHTVVKAKDYVFTAYGKR